MTADAKTTKKRTRLGKAMNYLLLFAVLMALTYGGLFKVRTKAWPWHDWNAFADFTSLTTRTAIHDAKQFTKEKVVPATSDLLARAKELLDDWDAEPADAGADAAADPEAPADEMAGTDEASGQVPPKDGDVEIVAERGMSIEAEDTANPERMEPVPAPRKIVLKKTPTDDHARGREKFKEALRHYQRSSPEMDGSQEQLKQAQDDFRVAMQILEKAKAADPNNRQIEEELQEVQTFLYDCQKRMTVQETY